MLTDSYIKNLISKEAKNLGFYKIGFAKADLLKNESEYLRQWISLGFDADMQWIGKSLDKRKNVRLILPDVKTVISLAYNYYTPYRHEQGNPKISRYAWGKDYHKIIKKKLKELSKFIEGIYKSDADSTSSINIKAIYYVDDGPVMDKTWAVKAGMGWLGKHTNVIDPEHGTWLFLSEIITNLELGTYDEPMEDLCGKCRICIDACPTGAIVDEYQLNSNLCISYQTIENHGAIPENISLNGWVFGCDICQDVCPFNAKPKVTQDSRFYPKIELLSEHQASSPFNERGDKRGFKTLEELERITEEEFNTVFADSPIKRTRYKGWKRNLDRFHDENS